MCASSTMSSRDVAKAQLASGCSDVEVTVGQAADAADELPTAPDQTSEKPGAVCSTSESMMRRKREFMTSGAAQEQYELQTSVASTMTPFRCVRMRIYVRVLTTLENLETRGFFKFWKTQGNLKYTLEIFENQMVCFGNAI